MFICGMVLRHAGTLTQLESGPITVELAITVVHIKYKLLINNVKPNNSLSLQFY